MTPASLQPPDATLLGLQLPRRRRALAPTPSLLAGIAAVGVVAATVAATLGAQSDVFAQPALNGAYRAVAIVSWVGVGLQTWRLRPDSRLGPLLIAAGAAFVATTPMALSDPGAYTLGRLAWVGLAAILSYVMLAFPSGELEGPRTRLVYRSTVAAVAAAWTVMLLGARELPVGGILTRCDGACPQNPYRVVDLGGGLTATLSDATTFLTSAMLVVVALLVLQRMRAVQGLARATLAGPFACLFVFALAVAVGNVLRTTSGDGDVAIAIGWLGVLAGLAVPWALLAGQARGQLLERALLVRRNAALEARLHASADELRASRARIYSAGSEERRRIERDLHDSGQNRLVALRIKLDLAAEEAEQEGASELLHARLVALGEEAQDALDAVRAIARGVYPPLLATGGLLTALEAEAQEAARPVAVRAAGDVPRSTPEAEAAVYYCCLEALQNSCKHAGPGAHVTLRLACVDGTLDFAVADDGPGFADGVLHTSTGLTHMRDRILAVGGTVELTNDDGGGALVHGRTPWPPRPRAEEDTR